MTSTIRTAAAAAVAIAALAVPATGAARVAPIGNEARATAPSSPVVLAGPDRTPTGAVPSWRTGRPCHHGLAVNPATGQIVGPVSRYGAVCFEA